MIRGNSQFGKSFQKLFVHKQQMFEDNDNMLIDAAQLMDFYQLQPARVNCKICDSSIDSLGAKIYHGKSKIEYSQCARCGHLNGLHQDTNLYMNTIYREAGGAAYGQNYKPLAQSDFDSRVNDIYLPKAQYLFDTAPIIKDPGVFLDIGCGTGHFASALTSMGLKSVTGIDVSSTQISSARKLVAGADFGVVEPDAIGDFMDSVQPRFVSLVGVLEHLQDPAKILNRIKNCKSVEVVFLSVPMYSLTVLIEAAFVNVFPRQLSGGHTHLFTQQSLDYASQEILDFDVAGDWWFGTDVIDLYRALLVNLGQSQPFAQLELKRLMGSVLDELQLVFDQAKLCSEVHRVLTR